VPDPQGSFRHPACAVDARDGLTGMPAGVDAALWNMDTVLLTAAPEPGDAPLDPDRAARTSPLDGTAPIS
jgi:hypothetical protein